MPLQRSRLRHRLRNRVRLCQDWQLLCLSLYFRVPGYPTVTGIGYPVPKISVNARAYNGQMAPLYRNMSCCSLRFLPRIYTVHAIFDSSCVTVIQICRKVCHACSHLLALQSFGCLSRHSQFSHIKNDFRT